MNQKNFNRNSIVLTVIIQCVIVLTILFAYSDVRHHQFLNFDDNEYVTDNAHVQRGFNIESIRWAFGFSGVSYWHPITWISHTLDCQLFGLAPSAHHLVNTALHILNALFLFLIIFRMTGARYLSAAVALLFAVHPVNLESVAWVAERKTVLSTFFLLISLYVYVRFTENRKLWLYCLMLCTYTWGLLSKPSIVVLPFLLLILDYWPLGRFRRENAFIPADGVGSAHLSRGFLSRIFYLKSDTFFLFLEKVPLVILSLISSYLSMLSMTKMGIVITHEQIPLGLRIQNLFVSITKYLGNIAWPVELSIFYPFPKSIPTTSFLLAFSFVALITVMTVVWRKRRPWLFAGWFWFLITLAPAGGLIQAGLWPEMANRFMYIPMIGIFLMLLWECDIRIRGRYAGIIKTAIFSVVLVNFVFLTRTQNLYYSNSYALFTRAAAITKDNFIAFHNIGDALASLNRIDEAMRYFGKAFEIYPKYAEAYNYYGVCLAKKGDYSHADSYFNHAISINKKFTHAYLNLGMSRYRRGYPDEAITLIEKAIELDPDEGKTFNNIGVILAQQGKTEEAIKNFVIAVKKKPNFTDARYNLTSAYEKSGLYDLALGEYKALNKIPQTNKGLTYYRMAGMYALQGKFIECKDHLELSLKEGFGVFEYLDSDGRFSPFRETEHYRSIANRRQKRS